MSSQNISTPPCLTIRAPVGISRRTLVALQHAESAASWSVLLTVAEIRSRQSIQVGMRDLVVSLPGLAQRMLLAETRAGH